MRIIVQIMHVLSSKIELDYNGQVETCSHSGFHVLAVINTYYQCTVQIPMRIYLPLIGPSRVRVLPLGVAEERSVHYFGPSGVRALPLGVAAKRSVHYIWYYFSFFFFFLCHILFSQKGLS